MQQHEKWVSWAVELQGIAQAGLYYCKDKFCRERYERLREIAAEIMAERTGLPAEKVTNLFCGDVGYQTPKIDTRGVIFKDGKILLVRESDGRWALPGGWCEVTLSAGENVVKEVKEEAGLDARPIKLLAVHDRARHNEPPYPYGVEKFFILCEALGGDFTANIETTARAYFDEDELPRLAEEKNTPAQIKMCFEAARAGEKWKVIMD